MANFAVHANSVAAGEQDAINRSENHHIDGLRYIANCAREPTQDISPTSSVTTPSVHGDARSRGRADGGMRPLRLLADANEPQARAIICRETCVVAPVGSYASDRLLATC